MARLPMYQQQQQVKTATAGAVQVSQTIRGGTGLAEGIGQFMQGASQLGNAIQVANEREAATYVDETRNRLSVEYQEFATDLSMNATTGKDYLEGIAKFNEKQRKLIADNAPNTRAAEKASQFFGQFEANTNSAAIVRAAEMNAEHAANVYQQTVDIAKTTTFRAPEAFTTQMSYIENSIASLDIPESRKAHFIDEARYDLNRSRMYGEVNRDPHKALAMMTEGDQGLNAGDYEATLNYAVTRKEQADREFVAMQASIDRQAAEMEKQIQDQTATMGYELAMTNGLTQEWILENRDNLSKADYKFFTGKMTDPDYGSKTDVKVYASAYLMASDDPEQAKAYAKQALLDNQLSVSDFNKINTMADNEIKGAIPEPYKRGSTYIKRVSGVDGLNPTEGNRVRAANAEEDFNVWFSANPNATGVEAANKAREIWAGYSLVDDIAALNYAPPYGTGVKSKDVTLDIVRASSMQLDADFKNGVLTESQYQNEKAKNLRWIKTLQEQGQ